MLESAKCGPDIKAALENSGIFYCYLDDFYSANVFDMKLNALLREVRQQVDSIVKFNINQILETAYRSARINMSTAEQEQFYRKYIKPMHLVIEDDGEVHVELKGI